MDDILACFKGELNRSNCPKIKTRQALLLIYPTLINNEYKKYCEPTDIIRKHLKLKKITTSHLELTIR